MKGYESNGAQMFRSSTVMPSSTTPGCTSRLPAQSEGQGGKRFAKEKLKVDWFGSVRITEFFMEPFEPGYLAYP